jgi:hypothetical protein
LPPANTFFIGRPPPPWQRGSRLLTNPYLIAGKREHPLLRNLTTLWDVGVSEAFRFHPRDNLRENARDAFKDNTPGKRALPSLTRLIETTGDTPLLFTLPRDAYTDLVLTFSLIDERDELNTNWPLKPSFPLFLRNVLYVLGHVGDVVNEAAVQPGDPMILRPEASVRWIEVTPPQGTAQKLERGPRPEFTYTNTENLGIYRVLRDDQQQRRFAVNLLDAVESDIEPRTEIQIGTEKVASGGERSQPRELWKWIALLALILLLIEWYFYNRRVSI